MLVFKKQVDNLKTNHRGVYVLTDHAFRPLSRMSSDAGGQALARAQPVRVPNSLRYSSLPPEIHTYHPPTLFLLTLINIYIYKRYCHRY